MVFTSRSILSALLVSAAFLTPGIAAAQSSITGPSDAGRVQERLKKAPELPAAGEQVQVRAPGIEGAPAGADKVTLTLKAVSFDGLTVYSEAELRNLYDSMVGQKISLADVYGIAAALTNKYRNDGYILTQVVVPPQTISSGAVKLRIVEGYIDSVTVQGDLKGSERKLIESYAEGVRRASALNGNALEQAMLLINDLPGVSARGVISPSKDKTGAADLTVVVERKNYDGLIGLDNYGSRYLGQYEFTGAVAENSMLGWNERIGLQAVYAPGADFDKELAYGDISYTQPVGKWGTKIELFSSLTSTDPGYTLKEFDILGRSVYWSAKVTQPITRTRDFNWDVYGLFDWRNVDTDSNFEATRRDKIRAIRAGMDVDFLDTFMGAGYNSLNIEIARGISVLGASEAGDSNLSRALGDPQSTKVEAEFQRLQRLTPKVNLLVGVKGQMATDAQLSSEEFGIGGPAYGRGYDPSEIVGDDGIVGKAEVQWNNPTDWSLVDTWQAYGFLDAGKVWNSDATAAIDEKKSLSSAGLGVRATFPAQTQAGMYVALPLSRTVESQGDQDPRFYFNLNQPF